MNIEISIERPEAMPTEHQWITTAVTADLVRGFVDLEETARGLLPHRLTARQAEGRPLGHRPELTHSRWPRWCGPAVTGSVDRIITTC
ncbi:hypothetical protein [Micromonospora arida]|uniref:hypothetical protein n=1 Tax=Micromonospora arida TaxID=2203715 RepID=UPI0033C29C58